MNTTGDSKPAYPFLTLFPADKNFLQFQSRNRQYELDLTDAKLNINRRRKSASFLAAKDHDVTVFAGILKD
jgi:hypothetical protein